MQKVLTLENVAQALKTLRSKNIYATLLALHGELGFRGSRSTLVKLRHQLLPEGPGLRPPTKEAICAWVLSASSADLKAVRDTIKEREMTEWLSTPGAKALAKQAAKKDSGLLPATPQGSRQRRE